MTIRNLDYLCKPRSITLLGSGGAIDRLLMRNLMNAGFAGPVMPVISNRQALEGVLTYPDVASLPLPPDLAVITLPFNSAPSLIEQLGARGTRAALILSDSGRPLEAAERKALDQAVLDAAKPYLLRVVGPDCLGVTIPAAGLNATLSQCPPADGHAAFVTHASAIARAGLDWGHHLGIGFSHLLSLGDAIDVDIADILDYLTTDLHCRAILLYLEQIHNPRKFMSAARRAARIKPVIALKPRRYTHGNTSDAVYEAAFRRAGILRVNDRHELFTLVETLTAAQPISNDRLAILSNSQSLSLLAVDTLDRYGGHLAALSEATQQGLRTLPGQPGTLSNPVDLGDLAGADMYGKVLDLLLQDRGVDGVLVINAPGPFSDPTQIAAVIIQRQPRTTRCIIASFVGPLAGQAARHRTMQQQIPTYETPDEAVRAFMRLVQHKRNQELLIETPPSVPEAFTPATETARQIIAGALERGSGKLDEIEAMRLLSAYGIPVVQFHQAADPAEAAEIAGRLGRSVALKIMSPDIPHKYRVDGVMRYLDAPQVVREAAESLLTRVQELAPTARIDGFLIQPIEYRGSAFAITLGVRSGGPFGPVIYFGQGGTEAEVIDDIAYGLPPLNMNLARELMAKTRIYPLLRDSLLRKVDLDALALTLLKVSQMVIDLGEIVELDINPLRASASGVVALDAQVRVAPFTGKSADRLAIRPYPKELEEHFALPDGRQLCIRPILPEDEPALQELVRRTPPEELRMRFFQPIRELPRPMAARLTQIDYNREMALVVTAPDLPGKAAIYGVVRVNADPDNDKAEYAILVDHDMTGLGLGPMLMRRIINYARAAGTREIFGEVLYENDKMLRINEALGFTLTRSPDDPELVHVALELQR
jgi:acetyltransferase